MSIGRILPESQVVRTDVLPLTGSVAKVQKERFEIAARFFESLAMTRKRTLRHCEEPFGYAQGKFQDEAISTFSTGPPMAICFALSSEHKLFYFFAYFTVQP
jgi:hypothetical protein